MTYARTGKRVVVIVSMLALGTNRSLFSQSRRDSLIAAASSEFGAARRVQLLISALDPTIGPPDASWAAGVQLLAQTLTEEGQDAVAAVWLRWGLRLAPDVQPDTVRLLPQVLSAYRAARDFVAQTNGSQDSSVGTGWIWPVFGGESETGRIQLAASAMPTSARLSVEGIGGLKAGASQPLQPGSYAVLVWAPGYDSVRVTREVLPGVTTVLQPSLHPSPASTAPASGSQVARHRGKRFPWALVAIGAAGVGGSVALLAGGKASPPSTGGIIIRFPNP